MLEIAVNNTFIVYLVLNLNPQKEKLTYIINNWINTPITYKS